MTHRCFYQLVCFELEFNIKLHYEIVNVEYTGSLTRLIFVALAFTKLSKAKQSYELAYYLKCPLVHRHAIVFANASPRPETEAQANT